MKGIFTMKRCDTLVAMIDLQHHSETGIGDASIVWFLSFYQIHYPSSNKEDVRILLPIKERLV